ncbi:MAG: head GIN domain-containing protein [Inhella sp.]
MSLIRRTLFTGATAFALTASAAAMAWSFSFCSGEQIRGDGKLARESRQLSGFDSIKLSGNFDLKLKQSGTSRVELEGDGNLLPYIETRVVDGRKGKTLEVSVKRGYQVYAKQALKIEIDVAALRAVAIAGSGKVEVDSFKSDSLDFSVSGSGTVLAPRVDVGRLGMSISGSGDIVSGGKAAEASVAIAGSGDVRAQELAADAVQVAISGSGDAAVQAFKTLKVSIAGSGDVRYSGNPELSTRIAGSGSVSKL